WQNYIKEEYTWNELSVNINDLDKNDISFYPNPVSDILTIKNNSQENYEIEIFDVSGKLFYNTTSKSTTFKLNISNYPKGIYFVNIIDDVKKSFKFIKNN
ncbi:MAG: T9SS type A sorting domain-containing protein, partial [Chlorobi bacterium]|nr:T9SS type A sorting domain-containing protein [Chlorobiota bacterium]